MWVRKSERVAANQAYVTLSDEKGLCTSKHRDVSPIMMTTTITINYIYNHNSHHFHDFYSQFSPMAFEYSDYSAANERSVLPQSTCRMNG